jgi:uncharacterized protein
MGRIAKSNAAHSEAAAVGAAPQFYGVVENDAMGPTRYGPGDVIFFKDGAHAKWHVEGHVRKLAFCRNTQPVMLGLALRVFSKLKRTVMPSGKRQPASLTA